MRRKEPHLTAGRGKSLIATRTSQHQRKMQPMRSQLPRSYSSPAQHESDSQNKGYVMRSFSSPEPKLDFRRNSDSFYRPKSHGSRSELDSDLENFEQFEEGFLDIDADHEVLFAPYRAHEREEPKRVMTTLLPGSGLQKVTIKPVSTHTMQGARDASKPMKQKKEGKAPTRLTFKPLVLKMPTHFYDLEHSSPVPEELQSSPQLEESSDLDRELENAEQHLARGVAMAVEESDADTSGSASNKQQKRSKWTQNFDPGQRAM